MICCFVDSSSHHHDYRHSRHDDGHYRYHHRRWDIWMCLWSSNIGYLTWRLYRRETNRLTVICSLSMSAVSWGCVVSEWVTECWVREPVLMCPELSSHLLCSLAALSACYWPRYNVNFQQDWADLAAVIQVLCTAPVVLTSETDCISKLYCLACRLLPGLFSVYHGRVLLICCSHCPLLLAAGSVHCSSDLL